MREAALARMAEHGEAPRTVYLQNHGLVALGASDTQVEGITAMAVKAARVLIGTHAPVIDLVLQQSPLRVVGVG